MAGGCGPHGWLPHASTTSERGGRLAGRSPVDSRPRRQGSAPPSPRPPPERAPRSDLLEPRRGRRDTFLRAPRRPPTTLISDASTHLPPTQRLMDALLCTSNNRASIAMYKAPWPTVLAWPPHGPLMPLCRDARQVCQRAREALGDPSTLAWKKDFSGLADTRVGHRWPPAARMQTTHHCRWAG